MIAIVHSIYSQSVHALALNARSMDNDAGRYCNLLILLGQSNLIYNSWWIPLKWAYKSLHIDVLCYLTA